MGIRVARVLAFGSKRACSTTLISIAVLVLKTSILSSVSGKTALLTIWLMINGVGQRSLLILHTPHRNTSR